MFEMRFTVLLLVSLFASATHAQEIIKRDFPVTERAPRISIENRIGRVRVLATEDQAKNEPVDQSENQPVNQSVNQSAKVSLEASSPNGAVSADELTLKVANDSIEIAVNQTAKRVDLTLRVPSRSRLEIAGAAGEIEVIGDFESVKATSTTGTIYADVPLDALKFNFLWTESRPRYLSETPLPELKEKAGGKFAIEGDFAREEKKTKKDAAAENNETPTAELDEDQKPNENQKSKVKNRKTKDERIALNFTTERGVILLNVPPSQVPSDLRERPLTEAVKAVVRSGDSILSEAIRKVSPKYFGDYLKTLPARRAEPSIMRRENNGSSASAAASLRRVNVGVTDRYGRALNALEKDDFTVFENGEERQIVDVQSSEAPFNLVLLLDVSGSVEERVNFIRKAARNFINTVSPQDKLAVITFRDDVEVLSNFSTDKRVLSDALDTFDAGGGTALYDSLAYVLANTLRPLRGERTAVVILSDGDDNRSFIPFEPLLGAVEESGALIYPLYVSSNLSSPTSASDNANTLDPLRARYLSLTSKAEDEAKKLAEASGGVYFPIRDLNSLQTAYDDVVAQLRTAYSITYRSKAGAAPRLRINVNREGAFAKPGSVVEVPQSGVVLKPEVQFKKVVFNRDPLPNADITGAIRNIVYKQFINAPLRELPLETLNINRAPPAFVVSDQSGKAKLAVSRWVSPKRTRSYPYERVYNTLAFSKRAAVIPVVKDEGKNGERDFLAWDTVSLLNLLEVYAVLAYYDEAKKNARKSDSLIQQEFNNEFVLKRIAEINETKLSAFEWNLRELQNLKQTIELARDAYQKISRQTGVSLHDASGLDDFVQNLNGDAARFLKFSRTKSRQAQTRETDVLQPKETLPTRTKSRITIGDYLGGKYFFTVDEAIYENGTLYLIESKHNQGGNLTSISDLKDGLVKMILYRNLTDVKRGGEPVRFKPVLRLTASKMQGAITSEASNEELIKFINFNFFDSKQAGLLRRLIDEARENNFLLRVEPATTEK